MHLLHINRKNCIYLYCIYWHQPDFPAMFFWLCQGTQMKIQVQLNWVLRAINYTNQVVLNDNRVFCVTHRPPGVKPRCSGDKIVMFFLYIFVSVSRLRLLCGMQAAKWVYCPAWPSHREVIIIAITITMILTSSLSRSPETNISLGYSDGDIATARRQFVGFCQTDAVTVKPTCNGQLVELMNVYCKIGHNRTPCFT